MELRLSKMTNSFAPAHLCAPLHSQRFVRSSFLQFRQVLARLRGIVEDVIGSSSIEDDEPLMAAGLDSLAGVELQSRVSAAFGVALPATVSLDYPTLKVRVLNVQEFLQIQRAAEPSQCRIWHGSAGDCIATTFSRYAFVS